MVASRFALGAVLCVASFAQMEHALSQDVGARDYYTIDGRFTVCKWGSLKDCEALGARHIKQYRLTQSDVDTIAMLEHLAGSKSFSGQDLINAFGQPVVSKDPSGEPMFLWFDQKDRVNGPSIGMAMQKNKVSVISYRVKGKFSMIWYNPDGIDGRRNRGNGQ